MQSNQYTNHPLLPLHQLLLGICTADEFKKRQPEILEAIHLAVPVLSDRASELCALAKGPYLKRQGAPTTPRRMAYYVESSMKETTRLAKPKKSVSPTNRTACKTAFTPPSYERMSVSIYPMTYTQLRQTLPTQFAIHTLAGRRMIEFENPTLGDLMVINSNGKAYHVTEADWNDARIIRSHNDGTPWATKHYTSQSSRYSYGLIHAAALLRHVVEDSLDVLEHQFAEKSRETR